MQLPPVGISRTARANLTPACTDVMALWPGGVNSVPLTFQPTLSVSRASICHQSQNALVTPVTSVEQSPHFVAGFYKKKK